MRAAFLVLLASIARLSAADIVVHADKSLGPMPFLYRNGNAVNVKPLGYPLQKFFADQKPGSFYVNNWGFDHYRSQGSSAEGLQRWVDDPTSGWNNNVEWMKRISAGGGEIILLLTTSYWLGPEDAGFPPKDLDAWEDYVRDTVDLLSNRMKLNVRYQVWDEPDTHFFRGKLDVFFEVVRRSVIGIKKANAKAKFGGPGSSWFGGRGFKAKETEKPLIYNFLKFCGRTPLPEVGLERIPVDFVAWHLFDGEPYTTQLKDQADQVRAWLKEFGYSEKTELNLDSWTRWEGLTVEESNGPFQGSYILPMVQAMEEAGITRHVYFNVFDHWIPEAAQSEDEFFAGGYGLFSRHFIVKSVYNAFQAMGQVEGTRLQVDESDPFLTAIAARDGKKIRLLVANYLPKVLQAYLLDNAPSLHGIQGLLDQVRELVRTTGKEPEVCADEVLAGVKDARQAKLLRFALSMRGKIDGKSPQELAALLKQSRAEASDQDIRAALDEVALLYQSVLKRQQKPIDIHAVVSGTKAKGRFEHYAIDSTHANAFALRDKIETAVAQFRQKDDQAAALRALEEFNASPEVGLKPAWSGMSPSGLERSFAAEPYSVHLIVFSEE